MDRHVGSEQFVAVVEVTTQLSVAPSLVSALKTALRKDARENELWSILREMWREQRTSAEFAERFEPITSPDIPSGPSDDMEASEDDCACSPCDDHFLCEHCKKVPGR